MKLTKKLEIGIQAMEVLKRKNGPTQTARLAEEVGTTVPFLEQVMKDLRKAGLVSTKKGPGGGYIFNAEKNPMSCFDVAQALGEDFELQILSTPTLSEKLNNSILEAFLKTRI